MQPYWTNGRQTIYCGDFGRVLPELGGFRFDLALLDPPESRAPWDGRPRWERQIYFGLPVAELIAQVGELKPDAVALWMPKVPLRVKARLHLKQPIIPIWAWGTRVKPLYQDGLNPEDGAEKPVLMLADFVRGSESVIDPFMGTGNSLLACKELGIEAVGVEMDEAKCAIAAQKLEAN